MTDESLQINATWLNDRGGIKINATWLFNKCKHYVNWLYESWQHWNKCYLVIWQMKALN